MLPKQHNLYQRDPTNFQKEDFILDLLDINWNETLQLNNNDPNLSFDQFYKKVNSVIDNHLPLKKLSKRELKSIKSRDKIFNKYINSKNHNKDQLHNEFKRYRNLIVKLTRQSRKNYYQSYFNDNFKNIRKTWDGIKSIINISNMRSMSPSSLNVDNKMNTNPVDIANCFNDYFS